MNSIFPSTFVQMCPFTFIEQRSTLMQVYIFQMKHCSCRSASPVYGYPLQTIVWNNEFHCITELSWAFTISILSLCSHIHRQLRYTHLHYQCAHSDPIQQQASPMQICSLSHWAFDTWNSLSPLSFCLFQTHVSAERVYLSELPQTLPTDDHFIVVSLEITFFSLLPHHLCSNSTFQTDYSSINVSVCEPPHLINITVDTIAADNICHVIWATIWVAVHVKQVSMVMFGGHASVVTVSHDSYSRPSQHQQDVWQTLQQQNYQSLSQHVLRNITIVTVAPDIWTVIWVAVCFKQLSMVQRSAAMHQLSQFHMTVER